jgi:hypothetical protein
LKWIGPSNGSLNTRGDNKKRIRGIRAHDRSVTAVSHRDLRTEPRSRNKWTLSHFFFYQKGSHSFDKDVRTWDFRSSDTLRSVDWQLVTDVSGLLIDPNFKGQVTREQ